MYYKFRSDKEFFFTNEHIQINGIDGKNKRAHSPMNHSSTLVLSQTITKYVKIMYHKAINSIQRNQTFNIKMSS